MGSFGPAIGVYSRYDEVRTDTGEEVGVGRAIDEASEAVSAWRIEQLAASGLDAVEAEGRFVVLCWDVLGAAEFRFNEANLLGKAVGVDLDTLIASGLVTKQGDKIRMVSVEDRRRARALEPDEVVETLFESEDKIQETEESRRPQDSPQRPDISHCARRLSRIGTTLCRGWGRFRRCRQRPRARASAELGC